METGQVIWIVVAVVVVLALVVALVAVGRKRRQDRNEAARDRAEKLRHEAGSRAEGLEASRAEAQRARAEADAAEARATEAEQRVGMTEAQVEDRVREADRLDPEVDHRSDDYQPEIPERDTGSAAAHEPDRRGHGTDGTPTAAEHQHEPEPERRSSGEAPSTTQDPGSAEDQSRPRADEGGTHRA